MSRTAKWIIGGTFLFLLIVFVLVALILRVAEAIPSQAALVVELDKEIAEQPPPGLAQLGSPVIVLHQVLDSIDTARSDDRVAGLVVKVSSFDAGWAAVQEIRSHLLKFRESKKPSICYLHGDMISNKQYYLASACEQVWLTPTANLGLSGMMSQSLFLRGTLDKLHVKPNMFHIDEYKTAMNMFTEKKYTAAHREMSESILNSAYRQYVSDAAEARGVKGEEFDAALRGGPYLASEAAERKLVDRVAYWDEVQDFFKQKFGDWKPVQLGRYVREVTNEGTDKIAVVHASGLIVVGESDYSSTMGAIMGSDSVAADLRRARKNKAVKAIVLRVDSGGGSAVASEIIRREVELANKEKPLIVSMGDVAASGGYWISMSGRKIVADPTTLTASIGVVFGKMNINGLYNLLGLSVDHVATSENATTLWPQQDFTPRQEETVKKFMHNIYQDFIQGVAAGRGLKVERVDQIGRGRVWTGAQAKDLGLVDELGGEDRALALAREAAGIAPDAKVGVIRYPQLRPWWKELLEEGRRSTVVSDPLAELQRVQRVFASPVQAVVPLTFDLN